MGFKEMESTLWAQEVEVSAAYTSWKANSTIQGKKLRRNSNVLVFRNN